MLNKFTSVAATIVMAFCFALAIGCKAKVETDAGGPDAAAVAAAQQLPEGQSVLTALDQKDYEAAVAGLAKIQQSIESGGDQESNFLVLKQHVKDKLMNASATDPKATEALNGLRFLTQGR